MLNRIKWIGRPPYERVEMSDYAYWALLEIMEVVLPSVIFKHHYKSRIDLIHLEHCLHQVNIQYVFHLEKSICVSNYL